MKKIEIVLGQEEQYLSLEQVKKSYYEESNDGMGLILAKNMDFIITLTTTMPSLMECPQTGKEKLSAQEASVFLVNNMQKLRITKSLAGFGFDELCIRISCGKNVNDTTFILTEEDIIRIRGQVEEVK